VVFYLGWAQGFPRKNRVFRILFYSAILNCSLPSQEQAARTGAVVVSEKLATTFKNTIHPPLVFCTHNPNILQHPSSFLATSSGFLSPDTFWYSQDAWKRRRCGILARVISLNQGNRARKGGF